MKIHYKLILGFLAVALLVVVVGIVGYFEIGKIHDSVDEITEFRTPALIKLSQMKAAILEGIEESFAYLLLNDLNEKVEFYEKMDEFDRLTDEFNVLEPIGKVGEEEETELFNKIITTKQNLVRSATKMFESYENGIAANKRAPEEFEEEIDALVPLINQFIEIEKKEIQEAKTATEIVELHSPALIKLQDLKSNILEATEEAFGYLATNEIIEKEEFLEKAEEFDILATEFITIAKLNEPGEEEEKALFDKITTKHSTFVSKAKVMFETFENAKTNNINAIEAFEEDIDVLIPLIDQFVEIETEEVEEAHLAAEKSVAISNRTIPLVVLMTVVLAIVFGLFISRSISSIL